MKQIYRVLGIMSGTSLDGVDLAFCEFSFDGKWSFSLVGGETISYSQDWYSRLSSAHLLTGEELIYLHTSYGSYLGKLSSEFCRKNKFVPELISSHGHTVFHQPHRGFTLQIGDGNSLAASAGVNVVSNFRMLDVALGGQGAPLVPLGDKLLFPEADYCLNLGGIANISFDDNAKRIAFDICPANMILNFLAAKTGKKYDEGGQMAASGNLIPEMLSALNTLDYYQKSFPKSLGREDVERDVLPIVNTEKFSANDVLHTFCVHIAQQVSSVLKRKSKGTLLVSGGGALNNFLIECLQKECQANIIVPSKSIINFKEAIIFAFLGVLRMRNEVNCLSSVTGAVRDCVGGEMVLSK